MRGVALVLAALLPSGTAYNAAQWTEFQGQVRTIIKNATRGDQLAISMGWVDQYNEFGFAAGMVNNTDGTRRPPTTNDTYLYGSGSKVLTSTAILSLVDRGVIGLDDLAYKHVDRLLGLYANTSLVKLWGDRAKVVTIRMLLHMSSGIVDYDNWDFDDYVLFNRSYTVNSPELFVSYPSLVPESERFYCYPGTCRAYSSTGYVLLGLVLTAHSGQDDWAKVKTSDFWNADTQAKHANEVRFFTDEPLQKWLTVPGVSYTPRNDSGNIIWDPNFIAEQNSSITGFTCANAVTSPLGMARLYHSILHDRTVLQPSTMKEFETFELLSEGWAAGYLSYGLGLQQWTVDLHNPIADGFNKWGDYVGHGGIVYGYNSNQGYFWGLNATISVAFNADGLYNGGPTFDTVFCQIAEAAANTLYGAGVDFLCWAVIPGL